MNRYDLKCAVIWQQKWSIVRLYTTVYPCYFPTSLSPAVNVIYESVSKIKEYFAKNPKLLLFAQNYTAKIPGNK